MTTFRSDVPTHSHGTAVARDHLTVALLGNPNVGKTTLFNALTGLRQRVGNYPGVTVERKVGHVRHEGRTLQIIDLPGTYSLSPRSPDEMLAVDVLLGRQAGEERPDVIVAVVDAANVERNLYLVSQLLDLERPVVVALNMMDVATSQGTVIDAALLGEKLGITVVPIQANKRKGVSQLLDAITNATAGALPRRSPILPQAVDEAIGVLSDWLQSRGEAVPRFLVQRLLMDAGGSVETGLAARHGDELVDHVQSVRTRLAHAGCPIPAIEARARYAWIRERLQGSVARAATRPVTWTDRLDRILTHKLWGTLVFLGVMFMVFQSIFTWAAPLMNLIGTGQDWLASWVGDQLPAGVLRSLLADGIIAGVGGVLVFLPQILILFGFIAILEDCGYVARAAFLMDRIMSRCGLSGKSFIPLLSSFACAIPGVMATRVIEDRRDRLTTILVAPLMSCSARLPVYTLLIAAIVPRDTSLGVFLPGLVLFALYLVGIVVAPLVALVLKRTLLRGDAPIFLMELPSYKWPSPGQVVHRMLDRGWAFVRRAGTVILASMILVWALLYFPTRGADQSGQILDYPLAMAEREQQLDAVRDQLSEAEIGEREAAINHLRTEWKSQSWLGRLGKSLEPAFAPLGWDWRITVAALASFPAREVIVGTLGIIYELGEGRDEESTDLQARLRDARWDAGSARAGQPVYTLPTALSIMVFFALCCQCASTLAVIRRETNGWRWPAFTFAYMTALAYVGAFATYQLGTWLGG